MEASCVGDVAIDEFFQWKDSLGIQARLHFGKGGAHVNAKTYGELKKRCDYIIPARYPLWVPVLNQLTVHVAEGVPDGILRPCDCK